MNTVCPNCHQKYDITSEHLHTETICEKCHQNFVIEPAIFCTECGMANSEKHESCFRCGKSLTSATRTERPPAEPPGFRRMSLRENRSTDCTAGPSIETELQKIELAICSLCEGKVSPLASSCPHCGHPKPLAVKPGMGIVMTIIMLVIFGALIACWTAVSNPNGHTESIIVRIFLGFIAGIVYACIWLTYVGSALRRNEVCKMILLTILPGIGIIVCSFFPSKS